MSMGSRIGETPWTFLSLGIFANLNGHIVEGSFIESCKSDLEIFRTIIDTCMGYRDILK